MNQEENVDIEVEATKEGVELEQFCDQVELIQQHLNEYITKQDNNQGEDHQRLLTKLQENLDLIKQKVSALRRQEVIENKEELSLLIDEVTKIVKQTNDPYSEIQYERNDLNGLELEYIQPKRIKEVKNPLERKQERKRARIQRSKQAIQILKKYVIVFLIGLQKFIKDPENIAKLFVIAVSCFFVSSFLQIPDMSNRHSLYIIEWLAYNRCARVVLISGSFCFVSLTWYIILLVWIGCLGMNETKGKLNTLIHDCNPILSLTLLFMTDSELINNKLDLAIWFCYIFQYSTYRVYYLHSINIIKKVLSTLTQQNFNKVDQFQQIYLFSFIVLALNAMITLFGILMLYKVGFYALSLLFYGGISTFVEYTKLILVCKKLQTKYTYFINNNIEQLTEPQFYQEVIPDIIYQALRIVYCSQLIVNYFRTINFHIFLHLWLFQIFSDLQGSLSLLKKNVDQLVRYKRIQQHLDQLFPRTLNIEQDEICIICHEELILARTLPCSHRFHLKCLFGWLKAQQQCPICRAEVPIELEQPQQIISRIFTFITQFNISNFTVLLSINNGRQQDLQLAEWEEQAILGQQLLQQQQLQQLQRANEQLQEQQVQQLPQEQQPQQQQPHQENDINDINPKTLLEQIKQYDQGWDLEYIEQDEFVIQQQLLLQQVEENKQSIQKIETQEEYLDDQFQQQVTGDIITQNQTTEDIVSQIINELIDQITD